ncbi:3-oxoacyl-[acyl-carrier-protein] synthase II [Paenibacillus cellulosilyticus]|uniref:3-oxoacyl-[acyl-carrier-protein] synthase II n=1 Tax=Paenibacillus cellulosilyticus TaxID=375489 RepID=A0A2V2YZ43_9BACL|nr:beta-ketoacyl-[acyl-carrier-protein] synthase family protein [Paenibacillus cellulosilyticus]PWW06541.1 3-oxoacyl-[acyl-carrier-protein] synthase II [Paenibacillus cellulosilyticus]QKS46123.1 beta-ketoacyl-[acyl-carrier-protein] synthase family protein [Paenibacillus cellulosilyticus]
MRNRVVVTGYGVITPFGYGDSFIRSHVFEGRHAFSPVRSFDTRGTCAKWGAEAPIKERSYRAFNQYCLEQALSMSGLDPAVDRELLEDAVVAVGNLGEGNVLLPYYAQFQTDEAAASANREISGRDHEFQTVHASEPLSIHDSIPSVHADEIAARIGSSGSCVAFTNACVASANAIGYGFDQIRNGRTNCAFVGGIHVLYPKNFYQFDSSRAMADHTVRPFSKGRTGLLIGDGAAILVLENLDCALRRGAKPLAEIVGWGVSSDGFHVTQPEPEGRGLACAMETALRKAGLAPRDIDYVNAHGTGTPLNDRCETKAYKRVFGDYAGQVPISSTKSTTGHMLEATGAVEAIISVISLLDQRIPPTANYEEQEEGMDLDYVTEGARKLPLRTVMSNSSAFGGNNCSLIVQRGDWNVDSRA